MQGARAEDFARIEGVIDATLADVAQTGAGLTRERIDSFLHQYELSLAHVPGQRGLSLLFRVAGAWTHDACCPLESLDVQTTLAELRVKLDGPRGIQYLQDLLRESVLCNTHRAVVTMSPDADFLAKQTAVERSVLGARLAAMSDAQRANVQVRADALAEAQSRAQEVDVLPTLRRADIPQSAPPHAIRDLDIEVDIGADANADAAAATEMATTKGATAKHAKASSSKSVSVPLQFAPQPTNGVVYLKTSLDISALRPEFADASSSSSSSSSSASSSSSSRLSWAQWDLIPMLTQLAPSIATRHRSAEQLAHDTNRFTGGISLAASILPGAFDLSRRRHAAAAANDTTISARSDPSASAPSAWPAPRTHLALSSHALHRNAGDMLTLCAEVVAQPRFDDAVRLRALVGAANAGMMNALQESGHSFARSYVFLLCVCFPIRYFRA